MVVSRDDHQLFIADDLYCIWRVSVVDHSYVMWLTTESTGHKFNTLSLTSRRLLMTSLSHQRQWNEISKWHGRQPWRSSTVHRRVWLYLASVSCWSVIHEMAVDWINRAQIRQAVTDVTTSARDVTTSARDVTVSSPSPVRRDRQTTAACRWSVWARERCVSHDRFVISHQGTLEDKWQYTVSELFSFCHRWTTVSNYKCNHGC